MKRLCILCAITLMGGVMAVAQDQAPQTPRDDNPARTERTYTRSDRGFDWGWLGLLGLLGLAGRRRGEQGDRTYVRDARDRAA
jgi:MYXO-CTERM domain-containing protein